MNLQLSLFGYEPKSEIDQLLEYCQQRYGYFLRVNAYEGSEILNGYVDGMDCGIIKVGNEYKLSVRDEKKHKMYNFTMFNLLSYKELIETLDYIYKKDR